MEQEIFGQPCTTTIRRIQAQKTSGRHKNKYKEKRKRKRKKKKE